jgi:hypothetical protein
MQAGALERRGDRRAGYPLAKCAGRPITRRYQNRLRSYNRSKKCNMRIKVRASSSLRRHDTRWRRIGLYEAN